MNKKVLSVLFASFMGLPLLFAGPITAFRFEGLKKTKEFAVKRSLDEFIGFESNQETFRSIKTDLQASGIFSEIELEEEEAEDGTVVVVNLKEKISFLAVPLCTVSGGNITGGAFVLDMNAFGLMHTMALGGFFSKKEFRGITMFSKPPAGRAPGASIFMTAGRKNQIYCDMDDKKRIDYDMISANIGGTVTEKFSSFFTGSLTANFGFRDIDRDKDEKAMGDSRYVEIKPDLKLGTTDWNGVFLSSKSIEEQYEICIYTDHYIWHRFKTRIVFQQPVIDDLRFFFSGTGIYGLFVPYSAFIGNSALGVRLFPKDFGSKIGGGINTGFEYAAFKTKMGIFSLYGCYQVAVAKDFDREYKLNQGVGGGMQMYLKQLAIPAMSFGVVYNTTKKTFASSFSIGMNF